MRNSADPDAREARRKLVWRRTVVDLIESVLRQQADLTLEEGVDLAINAKQAVLRLHPEKEGLYDLVYTSRFARILVGRFGEDARGKLREPDPEQPLESWFLSPPN